MVKAAVLGIQNPHGMGHLRTLQVLPEVDSIFCWGDDEQSLIALQKGPQGAKIEGVFTDLDELLAREEIFFVIATLRPDLCPDICLRVLDAGVHILAEKPLGRRAADAERIVAAAEKAGLKLGICYTNRHHPLIRRARTLFGQGVIGALMSIEIRMITTQVRYRHPEHWVFKRAVAGGGYLAYEACHYIDLMRFVTGDEIVSVAAEVATRSGEEIDVEDIATVSFRFRSGAVGSLHAGYVMAFRDWAEGKMPGYDHYFGFNGQAGRIYWNRSDLPLSLHVESMAGTWSSAPIWELTLPSLPESPAYGGVHGEDFVRDFILAAQGEGDVPASGRDALQVARIIDAAYESSRTGRRVEVECPD